MLWSIDPGKGVRQLWKHRGDFSPQFAWDVDPYGRGVIVSSAEGLMRLDDEGKPQRIEGASAAVTGAVREIRSAPFLRSAFLNTAHGWRVLDEDGAVRRIKDFDEIPRKEINVLKEPGRVMVFGGDRVSELVRNENGRVCPP